MKRTTQIAFWASLIFLALVLLAFSDMFQTVERLVSFTAASNWLRYGRPDLHQLAWMHPATGGNILASAWMASFIWLGYNLPRLNAIQMALAGEAFLAAAAFGLLVWIALWAAAWRRRFFALIILMSLMGIIWLAATRFGPALSGATAPLWLENLDANSPSAFHLLLPPLVILLMAAINLAALLRPAPSPRPRGQSGTVLPPSNQARSPMPIWAGSLLTLLLVGQMMLSASHLSLRAPHAAIEATLLEALTGSIQAGDALLVSASTPDEAREVSLRLLAYDGSATPTYVWPDAEAVVANHNRIWDEIHQNYGRVWLFERGLLSTDPLRPMAIHLGRLGFPIQEGWIEGAGRLSLYTLGQGMAAPVAVGVPFEAGISLVDFSLLNREYRPGTSVQVRLTWRLADAEVARLSQSPVVAFVHLLADANPGQVAAQSDRKLVDLPNHHQSPLLSGQTVPQGYGLMLPRDLPPGAYSLIAGLYDAASLQRLPRADGSPDDFLYLTTIQVE
jgi:hypothetical protein